MFKRFKFAEGKYFKGVIFSGGKVFAGQYFKVAKMFRKSKNKSGVKQFYEIQIYRGFQVIIFSEDQNCC